ncbi:hypothetical protein T439DRAFT_254396 [Meredithblackwellia eburnea MCA 4105]
MEDFGCWRRLENRKGQKVSNPRSSTLPRRRAGSPSFPPPLSGQSKPRPSRSFFGHPSTKLAVRNCWVRERENKKGEALQALPAHHFSLFLGPLVVGACYRHCCVDMGGVGGAGGCGGGGQQSVW